MRSIRFLPDNSIAGGALPWVIGVMVYLSTLASGFGLALNAAMGDWASSLADSVSVQIVNAQAEERDAQAAAALEILRATPGVRSARRVSPAETAALLEPWLGRGNVTDALPVPALLDVILEPGRSVASEALAARLEPAAPDAEIDDHARWLARLEDLTEALQGVAAVVVGLLLAATAAIAAFGTRAGLASHRESIEIMHLMGAEDSAIAGEFRHRFMLQGLKGGLLGLVLGTATLIVTDHLARELGAGLVPALALGGLDWLSLGLLPALAAGLTMLAAQVTVRRELAHLP